MPAPGDGGGLQARGLQRPQRLLHVLHRARDRAPCARPPRARAGPSRGRPAGRRSADAASSRPARAMRAAGSPGATPQRRPPTSISTSTSMPAPALRRRRLELRDVGRRRRRTRRSWPGAPARPAGRAWRAPATSLETSTSPMPPATITSASDTFWQHTPTAPSAICLRGDDRATCASWHAAAAARRPCARSRPCAARLRSKASRSIRSAGVSTCGERHADGGGRRLGHEPAPHAITGAVDDRQARRQVMCRAVPSPHLFRMGRGLG